MTSQLREQLEGIAAAAPLIPDPDRLIDRDRRRRRRVVVGAPVAAGLAVLVAIGVSMFLPRHDGPPDPTPPAVPWLPAKITAPDTKPTALPAERAVGKGSVIYSPCKEPSRPSTCREYVITEDGSHYRIPWTSDKFGNLDENATLSPDGRWLGGARPGEFRLRDLTGDQVHTVDGDRLAPVAWSPDSRWLVVGPRGVGPEPEPFWRLDTRTGEAKEVKAPFRIVYGFVIDVTSGGEVLLTVPDPRCRDRVIGCVPHARGLDDVALVDPDRGERPLWTRKLDDEQLRRDPEDQAPPLSMRLAPDGESLLVALGKSVEFPGGKAWAGTSGDLVLFDLTTGEQTRRYDITDGTVLFGGPGDRSAIGGTSWEVLAHDGDGILLRGSTSEKASVSAETGQGDSRISFVDPESGEERVVTRAPGIRLIAVRGGVNSLG